MDIHVAQQKLSLQAGTRVELTRQVFQKHDSVFIDLQIS